MILLEETIDILKEFNKVPNDVVWCGSELFGYFNWEDFEEIAKTKYDCGYGSSKVAEDLLIVGKDFWLERHEYDGSEWWEYKKAPNKPKEYKKPVALTIEQAEEKGFNVSCGWENLSNINGEKTKNENI